MNPERKELIQKNELLNAFIGGSGDCSCLTCPWVSDVSDGPEYGPSWYVCEKEGREFVSNLKWFPFKTPQPCWVPDLWDSRYTKSIRTGSDLEVESALNTASKKVDFFIDNYPKIKTALKDG